MTVPKGEFDPTLYSGWPNALRRMAGKMYKENMSDLDAAELKVAAGVFERAMKEILRLRRQIVILTTMGDPLPGLRMEDAGAFFDGEVCEKVLDEVFSNPVKLSDMPAAQEFRTKVTPGIEAPKTEEAHRRVSEGLGATIARRVDAEILENHGMGLRPGIVGHNIPVKGIAQGLTTEAGQSAERQDSINKGLHKRLDGLEKFVFGRVKNE